MIGCLWTHVRKQSIIALYFEFETVIKLYNLEARSDVQLVLIWVQSVSKGNQQMREVAAEEQRVNSVSASVVCFCKQFCSRSGPIWIQTVCDTVMVFLKYIFIIPTPCFYHFFGDFDWSLGKIKWFLHFNKNLCV